jgi:hypothetical protein
MTATAVKTTVRPAVGLAAEVGLDQPLGLGRRGAGVVKAPVLELAEGPGTQHPRTEEDEKTEHEQQSGPSRDEHPVPMKHDPILI